MKPKHIPSLVSAIALAWLITPEALAQNLAILPDRGQIEGLDFREGKVHMIHFPALIMYWIQMLLQLAGGFAVVMIMVGGVHYMIGSVNNDREQGKKTLTYAISGLLVAFFAWWIVELIQIWITG